jgi:hypothetical protein
MYNARVKHGNTFNALNKKSESAPALPSDPILLLPQFGSEKPDCADWEKRSNEQPRAICATRVGDNRSELSRPGLDAGDFICPTGMKYSMSERNE